MSDIEKQGGEAPNLLQEERGVPPVNKRKSTSKVGKVLGLTAIALLAGVMFWINVKPKGEPVSKEPVRSENRRGLPDLKMPEPPPPPPPPLATTAPTVAPAGSPTQPMGTGQPQQPQGPSKAELELERRKRAPIIAFGGGGSAGNAGGSASGPSGVGAAQEGSGFGDEDKAPDRNGLAANLQADKANMSTAAMLPNRNYLLASGTMLDCTLVTALDSTVPGKTKCTLARNVYSDNNKVLLLERGSVVEGEYRTGGMRQGMSRIFVLWTRVRTPHGVWVTLDSPGADELGRSGLSGWIDTHFWTRYGGALLLSVVDDTAEYLARQSQGQQGDNITFGGTGDATQQAAAIALQNTINIPPTLNKNQGDRINIYVARDLDFRSVYALRSR
ncbi:type IV secretion system protein VirB10 [Xanthomonas campestris pv. campestris]|nr:type IV secretion system protein VirB10 [Xanthomonas campestris pv. campestris]MEB1789619.1 type IV secretion system protein VirB10 [Xanthomonas campestris pv. campestris]MEB1844501.1 type IV secretion system protein VirB10 [Xanthomonas campestris pv. campestris]MEB1878261.1 type IV secretion system protein VirB10 [Xanthomonas campestris pv. campestris]